MAAKKKPGAYVLYGSRNSGSASIECVLELIGAPYRIVSAASWDKKSAQAELKRVNPLMQIPTLLMPDGTVLTESAAILVHLALVHPRAQLLPKDPALRAQALRALVFVAANCYTAIGIIDYPARWHGKGDAAADERLRKGTRKRLHKLWELFADSFAASAGKDGFLFGAARPGAADLLAAVVSRWAGARKHLARRRPDFHALLERVEAHPKVAAVFARHWGAGPVAFAP